MSRVRLALLALGGLLALVLLVAAASWLAVQRYGPALARERVEQALAGALERPVRVERVRLRPWLARVTVEGLAIAAGPTWEAGTLAQVGRTDVTVSLASLWRRHLVLGVRLADVDIRQTATAEGEPFVFPAAIPDRVALGPITAVVGSVAVERARVHYRDSQAGWTLVVDGLGARARPADGGLDVILEIGTLRATTPGLAESIEGVRAAARLRGRELTIDRLQARWRGEPIHLAGQVRELGPAPVLALSVRGRLPLDAVAALAGLDQPIRGVAAVEGSIDGRPDDPRLAARVTIGELVAAGVTARTVTGEVAWGDGTLRLDGVTARALGGTVGGALVLTPARPRQSRLTLRLDGVSLADVEAVAGRPLAVRGHVTASGTVTGDLRDLTGGEGAFRIESSDLVLPEPLARLGPGAARAEARLAGGTVAVDGAEGRWPGLHATSVTGRLTGDGPRGLAAVVVADLGALAKAWGQPHLGGQARVTATLGGRWTDLVASGELRARPLSVAGVGVDAVDSRFDLAGRTLALDGLTASLDRSRLEGVATIAWTGAGPIDATRWREAVRVEARLAVPEARLEDLHRWLPPEWRGTGRFTVESGRIAGTAAAWRASGQLASEAATVRGEPLTGLSARVTADQAGLEAADVRAAVRGIPVTGRGTWQWASATGRAHVEAGPASLGAVPGLADAVSVAGTARASADLALDAAGVSGSASANATGVAVAGIALGRGTLQARLDRSALTASLAFPEARMTATATGQLRAGQELQVGAQVTDLDLAPLLARVTVPSAAGDVAGRVSATATLAVPSAAPARTHGTIRLDPVRVRVAGEEWRNVDPIVLERQPGATRVQQARLESGLGTARASGVVQDDGGLDLTVQGQASLAVLPALRAEIREAAGALEVSGRITGTTAAPRGTGSATVRDGRVVARAFPEPVTGIRARATLDGDRVRIAEMVGTVGGGEARVTGEVQLGGPAPRLDLRLAGQLPLSALAALRPEVREAAGVLQVDGRVTGTTAAPQAVGDGTIRDGRLLLAAYPEALREIQARFTVSPAGLRVTTATASLGGGSLAVRGDLALDGRQVGAMRLDVEARQVSVEPAAGVRTTWDADLEVVGVESRTLVRGEARLVRGSYVSDQPLLQLLFAGGPGGGGGGGEPALAVPLQVRVRLQDNLTVRTAVTRFRAGGTVTLQGTTADPVVFGTVEVREGQLIFRRQRFTISSASARFTDPRRIDPFLDVRAQARIQAHDVTLRMTGRAEQLEIRLTSAPPLPEEDILSLIAFGSTRQQLTRGGATAVAGEMAGLIIQDLFGFQSGEGPGLVDVFEMETTEAEGRTVRVGRRLGARTMVLYSQGIDRSDARRLRIEYEVIGPLVIAGEQDFRGGVGGDVLLRLRFR